MGSNLITILLPVYNDEKYLEFCLKSIKNQTYKKFVCLVGFNGTVDNSKEIFREVVGEDSRFTMIDYGTESGKSKTLNKLLSEVKTKRFCLMDGDDIWHPEKLRHQVKVKGDLDVVGTLTTYIDEFNRIGHSVHVQERSDDIKKLNLLGMNQIINSSCLVKTSCLREIGGWDPEVEGLEDFDVWVKLSLLDKDFYNVQIPLVYHRVHRGSNFNSKPLNHTPFDIIRRNKK